MYGGLRSRLTGKRLRRRNLGARLNCRPGMDRRISAKLLRTWAGEELAVATPAGRRDVFSFGLFEADPASGQLLREGERVRLQDQPFRMLILMLERTGEVITREELREKLWPENTFVEFDNGLNVAVKKIRDALGDNAENPRFVETLPRRGYRFIAPLTIKAPLGASAAPAETTPAIPKALRLLPGSLAETGAARSKSRRRYYLAATAITVLVVAGFVVLKQIRLSKTARQLAPAVAGIEIAPRRSVAVMEFQNVPASAQNGWLSTAIPEMLSTELAAGEKLRLIPGEDVARMKRELHLGSSGTLAREIAVRAGKNLKVDILVTGSFTAVGPEPNRRIRIDLRLQDARNGEILAEVEQTGTEEHLFEMIAQAGVWGRAHLGATPISAAEAASVRASTPTIPDAGRLYAEGLARLRVFDAAGARDLLTQAVAAEPNFPLSHMALASAWRRLGYDPKARAEAKKALDLSPGLPRQDRLLIEGRYHEMIGEMDQAVSAYRALFTLFPDSLEDGLVLATAQAWGGKPAEALATLDTLRRLPEPLSQDPRIDLRQEITLSTQGASGGLIFLRRAEEKARAQGAPLLLAQAQVRECSELLFTGHFDEAARACEESRQVFAATGSVADMAVAVRFLGDIRLRQGKLSEALEFFKEALRIDETAQNDMGIAVGANEMALVYEQRGDLREAEKLYRRSYLLFLKVGHRKNASVLAANVAGVLLQRGTLAEAERLLQQSLALARESGARDAEAASHRTMSELALLRGSLDRARQHTETAAIAHESDPVGSIADQDRLSRILADQGDLDGARKHQMEALNLAEKIGAKGQTAQSQLTLALLDLEEAKAAEAEPRIRAALAIFPGENMFDDDLTGHVLLSRCLLGQAKIRGAKAALDEVRGAAARNQNPARNLMFTIAEARVKSAQNPGASLPEVSALLQGAARKAHNLGFSLLEYEARLALGEAEMKAKAASGARSLSLLEKDARARGFELIAHRAAAARKEH
jgi:DNA-binding winged helix-turn-helix (wHTH) protein/tetratricopeptide (TPR) repeat protein